MKGVYLTIKVIPNASKTEIVGWENDVLKVRINASPEKDKANEALISFLSDFFSLPKYKLFITKGQHSRIKTVYFSVPKLDYKFFPKQK
jgi:uncharacterized protein (TIGR00251 family)